MIFLKILICTVMKFLVIEFHGRLTVMKNKINLYVLLGGARHKVSYFLRPVIGCS